MKLFRQSLLITFIISINLCYSQKTLIEEFHLSTHDGIQLSGEIEYPNKSGKFPAAILIWGNGPHTRDMEISGSSVFKQIADSLLKLDMAVLRMDKRGFGKSTGKTIESEGNYTTRDLANDVKLAYNYLNNQKNIDTTRVGLIGHSEGSIISSILLAEDKSIDWAIVLGPVAVSGQEIVAEQKRLNRKELGFSEETSQAVGEAWNKYSEFIKSGYQNDSIYYALGREFLIAHGLEKDDERITNQFIDQLINAYKTPWYTYFFNNDNADNIRKIKKPYMAIFGGNDDQTSIEQNLLPMVRAFKDAKNENYRIVILSDEDHFFLRYKDERMIKHEFGKMEVSGRLISTIKEWLASLNIIHRY